MCLGANSVHSLVIFYICLEVYVHVDTFFDVMILDALDSRFSHGLLIA